MTAEPRWISKDAVIAIQEILLAQHGGPPGVLDEGVLDSALDSPKNHHAHGEQSIFRLAAAYAEAITRNHPFQDGNKRLALTLAGVFLERNGHILTATEAGAVAAIYSLSTRETTVEEFARWVEEHSAPKPRG